MAGAGPPPSMPFRTNFQFYTLHPPGLPSALQGLCTPEPPQLTLSLWLGQPASFMPSIGYACFWDDVARCGGSEWKYSVPISRILRFLDSLIKADERVLECLGLVHDHGGLGLRPTCPFGQRGKNPTSLRLDHGCVIHKSRHTQLTRKTPSCWRY